MYLDEDTLVSLARHPFFPDASKAKPGTLVFLLDSSKKKLLLGLKKRGGAKGIYNAFGGKVGDKIEDEAILDAAVREVQEEVGVRVEPSDLVFRSAILFLFPHLSDADMFVYVFVADKWSGKIKESDEMKPVWFDITRLPYEKMWPADRYWWHLVFQDRPFLGKVVFSPEGGVLEYNLTSLDLET